MNDLRNLRERNICKTIERFTKSRKDRFQSIATKDHIDELLTEFQAEFESDSIRFSDLIQKQINSISIEREENAEKRYFSEKRKANLINAFIIENKKLKREIERLTQLKDSKVTNSIANKSIKLSVNEKQQKISEEKTNLSRALKLYREINKESLNEIRQLLTDMKTQVQTNSHQIQYDIYDYKSKMLEYYQQIDAEQFEKEKTYYENEIEKLRIKNKDITNSYLKFMQDNEIKPTEERKCFIKKIDKNRIEALRKEVFTMNQPKGYSMFDINDCAGLIVQNIRIQLQRKDEEIISKLKDQQMKCFKLKEKIKRRNNENKTQFDPFSWNEKQTNIAQNLHQIKLMQTKLFS